MKRQPLDMNEMESAISEAADMARMTVEFIGRALRLDQADPHPLSSEERNLLLFAVTHTMAMIERAKAVFYGEA